MGVGDTNPTPSASLLTRFTGLTETARQQTAAVRELLALGITQTFGTDGTPT